MSISELHITGYRSIRDLRLPLFAVNVILGANGAGKSNLTRALRVLHAAANGSLARSVVEDGGMRASLFASGDGSDATRCTLAVKLPPLQYEITLAPIDEHQRPTLFGLEPAVRDERVWTKDRARRIVHMERTSISGLVRNGEGARVISPAELDGAESLLSQLTEGYRFVEPTSVRDQLAEWRFYPRFRSDESAPSRRPSPAVRTMALATDAHDLASALRTIEERGDAAALQSAIDAAIPGARLAVHPNDGVLELRLRVAGANRVVTTRDLSDGAIQYLCVAAALLSPRPAPFTALDSPDTGLHPDLFAPLAALIAKVARRSQWWITTQSREFADAVAKAASVTPVSLVMRDGETVAEGGAPVDADEEPTHRS